MIAAWRRFRALDAVDRALTVEAAVRLITVWAGLRVVSFATLRRFLERGVVCRHSAGSKRASIDAVACSVAAVARRLPLRLTCLAQALAADAMLRRRGYASLVQLGVRRTAEGRASMEAHAWVECDGRVVFGDLDDLAHYAPLATPRTRPIDAVTAIVRGEAVPWQSVGATADEFAESCAVQGVTGVVFQRLTGSPARADWPSTVYSRLADNMRLQTASELVQREEIASVLAALARQDIRPILIKGTPLAYTLYDAPASRPRCDTDLVVPRQAVDAVRTAMGALGYTAPNACDGEVLFGQLRLEKPGRYGVGHAFDVHWRISSQSVFADVLNYDELAAHAVPVPALGPEARAASPLQALLIACLHPVMHHRGDEWLIWTYDIHLLATALSSAELERFADLAIRKRIGAICAHQLGLARARFGTAIPFAITERLASAGRVEPSAAYLRGGRRWHHEVMSHLRGLASWNDRGRFVREVLFPHPRYMLTAYGVTNRFGLMLVPALYVHRGVNGIWKVLAGKK